MTLINSLSSADILDNISSFINSSLRVYSSSHLKQLLSTFNLEQLTLKQFLHNDPRFNLAWTLEHMMA